MRVLVETFEDVIEGELLDGVSGGFDLGAEFTVRCDDGSVSGSMAGWLRSRCSSKNLCRHG